MVMLGPQGLSLTLRHHDEAHSVQLSSSSHTSLMPLDCRWSDLFLCAVLLPGLLFFIQY